MYTKKVLDLFKNPKNMGEIKNADGIGEVGNPICGDVMHLYIKVKNNKITQIKFKTFGCLPPEEKVVVSEGGWKDISSVNLNEEIINDTSIITKVSKTYEIAYEGPIFKLVPLVSPFNSFSITPEHPVLCVKRKWFKTRSQEPNSKWPRILDPNFLSKEPEFIDAKNLEPGDYLIFSVNQKVEDSEFFTKNWLRLIGYYLSEGYITANGSAVNFSFNKNEHKLINEVKDLVYRIISKKCSQRTRGSVTEVYVCSRKLARWLISFAGKFAREKKLSAEVMLLPPEKQQEIINTFYLGDGNTTIRRKGNSPTYRLATASESLAIQLQEILARNGLFSSIVKRSQRKKHFIDGREIKGTDLYIVSFKKERVRKFIHKREGAFLVPIKRIEKTNYQGLVYNLHVDKEPNSYLVRGFAVHNCVAAIATSSIVTELAKGKTLEQAEKITNQDVAKKLGGLPPMKMHCSVLAQQALKAAIKDYKRKLIIRQ